MTRAYNQTARAEAVEATRRRIAQAFVAYACLSAILPCLWVARGRRVRPDAAA